MDEFIKFNNQTAGRDKIFRLAQYTSRILWYNLQQRSSSVDSVERFKKVDELLGLMRRLLRFGRCFETFQSTFSVISLNNMILRFTTSFSRISNTCYMVIDHIVCLEKLQLLPRRWAIDSAKWDRWSTKFWLYSILLSLIRDGYEIFKIYAEQKQLSNTRSSRHRSPVVGNSGNSCSTLSFDGSRNNAEVGERFDESCPASRSVIMEMEVEKSTREIRQRFNWNLQQFLVKYFSRIHQITKWILDHIDLSIDTSKNVCDLPIALNSLAMLKLKPSTIGYLGVVSTVLSAMPQINPMFKMVPAM